MALAWDDVAITDVGYDPDARRSPNPSAVMIERAAVAVEELADKWSAGDRAVDGMLVDAFLDISIDLGWDDCPAEAAVSVYRAAVRVLRSRRARSPYSLAAVAAEDALSDLAASTGCPAKVLSRLASPSMPEDVRVAVAGRERNTGAVWDVLSADPSTEVRSAVAGNADAPDRCRAVAALA